MLEKEIKQMLHSIIDEISRVENNLKKEIHEVKEDVREIKNDVYIMKSRYNTLDFYALYNDLDKRMTELEKKIS